MFIVGAYQYSRSRDLLALLEEGSPDSKSRLSETLVNSLKNMDIDEYTRRMEQKTVPQRKLDKTITKGLERYGDSVDMLLKKQTYAQWREVQEKEREFRGHHTD